MSRGYILSAQASLFGKPDVIGFGDDSFSVMEIDRELANAIIQRNHYSHKFYNASYIHLGVYIDGRQVGVLQFGYAMNPASAGSVVEGTGLDQYLELNRMWLDDAAPHSSESRALSAAIKFIRRRYPRVRWIQSFADERCGKFGAVYQAAGFAYYGEHIATFWELDGVTYHNSLMTRDPALSRAAAILQEGRKRAVGTELRQFRYLYWLAPRFARQCRLNRLPFPKPHAACQLDDPAPTGLSGARSPEAAPIQAVAA